MSSLIADRTEFWWTERSLDDPDVWKSSIRLGEEFFNEIISHPVPLNIHILRALTRCSLGLDLYQWVNYRTFSLKAPLRISWRQIYLQFGPHPAKSGDKADCAPSLDIFPKN